MRVWNYIEEKLKQNKKMHMTLLDPDKQPPEKAGEMAKASAQAGTDAIMVGGSTGLNQANLDSTVQRIKSSSELPVILFPTAANFLCRYADAIYFMSMLNSRNLKYVVGEHKKGAPVIKSLGLEPISMGYIVVEPGMKVGEVGEADLLSRDAFDDAAAYALAAQYLGMRLVYFEAGSGAPEPVPVEMVKKIKSAIDIPLVIGGGIRTVDDAGAIADAGADIVVTGTIVEETGDIQPTLSALITAIKGRSENRK
ncbi:MAG: geranylgeranylglyceryl/heptaprenylglyceryl phosphate synthase [Thermoplasmata archaeon]|nr:MAG: geranylgeranylglyceryl/heptaprenylglyceryl phosphate synthase [Thermoplasmata archaeon]